MSLGPKYFKGENKQKISGADMLTGVLLSISYDKCPVDYALFILEESSLSVSISWEHLSVLIDIIADSLHKEFKPLTIGSAKQYLHAMRNGYRANKNGELPPLNVLFSEKNMTLNIPKRNYQVDKIKYKNHLPEWIFGNAN